MAKSAVREAVCCPHVSYFTQNDGHSAVDTLTVICHVL